MSLLFRVKAYYHLTKPGIIKGNLLSLLAGFLLASTHGIDYQLLFYAAFGVSLVIASGCVFNNYLDRGIDKTMSRTKKRALVTGSIATPSALLFATVLGLAGTALLLVYVNILTALVGLSGLVLYVIVYGIAKRKTVHGTLVGTLSGATPPLAGYVAVTGQLDATAWLLFLILVCWQMTHFYAIAIYRAEDYKAAGIPVLPLVKGIEATKFQMKLYAVAFLAATMSLLFVRDMSVCYAFGASALGFWWLMKGNSLAVPSDEKWARQMFGASLLVLLGWSALTAANNWLF